jgi:hypothetical protein
MRDRRRRIMADLAFEKILRHQQRILAQHPSTQPYDEMLC